MIYILFLFCDGGGVNHRLHKKDVRCSLYIFFSNSESIAKKQQMAVFTGKYSYNL